MIRQIEKPQQVRRLEVLDHLRREQPAERAVRQSLEIPDRVPFLHREPAPAAHLRHLVIQLDPARRDSICA